MENIQANDKTKKVEETKKMNAFIIVGFILGIFAVLGSGRLVLTTLAIIFSVIGLRQSRTIKSKVFGIIGLILGIIFTLVELYFYFTSVASSFIWE